MLAGASATGGAALAIDKRLDSKCQEGVCPSSHWDDMDRMEKLGVATDVLLGVGGAVAAAGVIMVVISYAKGEDSSPKLTLAPAVAPQFIGAFVSRRF